MLELENKHPLLKKQFLTILLGLEVCELLSVLLVPK